MISNFLLAISRQPATVYHHNRIMSGLEGTYDTVNTGTITAHHNQSALFEQAAYTMQRSSPLPQPTVIPGLLREFIRIIFNLSTFQNKLLTLEITKITFRFGCHLRHWQEVRFFIISSHHGIQLLGQDNSSCKLSSVARYSSTKAVSSAFVLPSSKAANNSSVIIFLSFVFILLLIIHS